MFGITLGAQMYEFDIVVCSLKFSNILVFVCVIGSSIVLSIDYLHLHVTLGVLSVCVPVCALYL